MPGLVAFLLPLTAVLSMFITAPATVHAATPQAATVAPAAVGASLLQLPSDAALLADTVKERHILGRFEDMTEWWHWLLLMGICAVAVFLIGLFYVFDSVELSTGITVLLLSLRVLAFGGLLVFFLNIEKRADIEVVKNSRVALLVDTSLSMGLRDGTGSSSGATSPSRAALVAEELASGDMINTLRQEHDVVAYRFSDDYRPVEIATFKRIVPEGEEARSLTADKAAAVQRGILLATIGGGFMVFSLVLAGVYLGASYGGAGSWSSWLMTFSVWSLILGGVLVGVGHLQVPEYFEPEITQEEKDAKEKEEESAEDSEETEGDDKKKPSTIKESPGDVQWLTELTPRGGKTPLSDAVRYLVNKERGDTIAGFVIISDGGQNSGVGTPVAVAAAHNAKIPLYAIGIGSDRRPENISVVDLEAPARVKRLEPGALASEIDKFTMIGLVRGDGAEGRPVTAILQSTEAGKEEWKDEVERQVKLGKDGEQVPVKFELPPKSNIGRWVYKLKIKTTGKDFDQKDNEKTADVEFVKEQSKVLMIAGGPTREFRFLRNQLHRDENIELHVWLQSAKEGVSQESDKLLFEFPLDEDEMFQYDCIVAFDPDWRRLDALQAKLLERWVAEKAGGMVVVAGPVFTPVWSSKRRGDKVIDTVKGLYPVVFYNRGSARVRLGRFGAAEAWPLSFTRDGREAEFLWVDESALRSEEAWNDFEGVYGYYAVRETKKGGRVYSRFADPDTAIEGELPIYMASHLYGAGRVFFQASGEMWRVRSLDDAYFERYYTRLVRWASEGRLLRDGDHGVLLVDKNRAMLGEEIVVTAILQNAQHEPETAPKITAKLVQPGGVDGDGDGATLTLERVKDGPRDGMYSATITAALEGDYRIQVMPPGSPEEVLTASVRVRVPDLEIENPQRNNVLLTTLTQPVAAEDEVLEGRYYTSFDAALARGGSGGVPLQKRIASQEKRYFTEASMPNDSFERLLATWLLGLIAGVLCIEWITRRLSRLA